ncbi:hypothetical protein BU23DRAFT_522873 [Bimuria novae-zelandiae CBS 107.79]|uniref:Zn(2)-C6 fungal-type domain-containing protein n=1 Tax=Bimuria novae-zelandiae CBS 107.79 TaxID=1447943 RepID=A0A6A5VP99_9PLEO|nr:hypothetical protein BU23DRAFT_522873 [Bimuria novae-zelandiae CBS 107.79]
MASDPEGAALPQRSSTSSEWVHVTGNPSTSHTEEITTTPDGTASETRSPPAKRRREAKERSRVSRACDRCKRKKTRCTGRCPCPLCLISNQPCEFTASYTRGKIPDVIIDEAALASDPTTARLRKYMPSSVSAPESSGPSIPIPTLQLSQTMSPPGVDVASTPKIFSGTDHLSVKDEPISRTSPEPAQSAQTDQQGHYVGPASGVSFLLRIQKTLHQNSSISHESSIFNFGDAPLPDFDPTFFVLPPKAEGEKLVERYFDFAAPTHRFLHRPTINKLLQEFYETQGDMRNREEAPGKTALLLIVMAQAKAYMPSSEEHAYESSARYYFASEHQLSKERGAVRLASVQARLGQCFYLLTQSRINQCWSLFGTLAHLAFAIGLNRRQNCNPSTTIDYVELESRRRLFWVAYVLDKYLAAALGRPRSFKDEDIDQGQQDLPTLVEDADLTPTSITPSSPHSYSIPMQYAPLEHIKLSKILSSVLRDLYPIRPPSLQHRLSLAQKYTTDLIAWRHANAHFLDTSNLPSSLLIPIYQRQRNVLNLAYYHAVLLVHRPFLISNFAQLTHFDAPRQAPPTPARPGWIGPGERGALELSCKENVTHCLDAAMGIVRVVEDIAGTHLFRAFWFTQYYAFCAVVVLYIYRIQQGIVDPGKCEGYYAAGLRCQNILSSISGDDCLSKRYCLVLEELRSEAAKVDGQTRGQSAEPRVAGGGLGGAPLGGAPLGGSSPRFGDGFYGGGGGSVPNNLPTPESAVFNPSFLPNSSIMADLTSWGQFDSLVTAGIGMLDGGGYGGDAGFGFGLGG